MRTDFNIIGSIEADMCNSPILPASYRCITQMSWLGGSPSWGAYTDTQVWFLSEVIFPVSAVEAFAERLVVRREPRLYLRWDVEGYRFAFVRALTFLM